MYYVIYCFYRSHVSELETIQDSLEAKLRQQHSFVVGVSPSSSTCTPSIPISSPSHPPLSSPSLGEQLISEPPLSPTHSIISVLLTPPDFPNDREIEPFTVSPPSCFNKTSTPLKSRDSTIIANETSQSIIDYTINTSRSSANDGLEGRTLNTPCSRENTAVLSHVSGNDDTTVNVNEQVENQKLNVVVHQHYKRKEDNIVDNTGEKQDTEIDDKTDQVLDTGSHTVEGKACMSMESSRDTYDSDGVSNSLNSSVSSIIKVVDVSNRSNPSNTSEDTSIMVSRTVVPNEQGPGLSTDEDFEEEEEVKRLFDKLLKERHQKSDQTHSSNSTLSSESSDSFDDSSSSSSDGSSTVNSNMGSPNKPMGNPETTCSTEMKQYVNCEMHEHQVCIVIIIIL